MKNELKKNQFLKKRKKNITLVSMPNLRPACEGGLTPYKFFKKKIIKVNSQANKIIKGKLKKINEKNIERKTRVNTS
jgi:hypothetical protein